MARLALEHLIKFLDGVAKFLAAIQLVGHQEVIENLVERCTLSCFLGVRRLRPIAEHVQVAGPPQVKRPGGGSQPPRLFEETQGFTQVLRPVRPACG